MKPESIKVLYSRKVRHHKFNEKMSRNCRDIFRNREIDVRDREELREKNSGSKGFYQRESKERKQFSFFCENSSKEKRAQVKVGEILIYGEK